MISKIITAEVWVFQPKLKAEANNPYWDLDYSGYQKNQISYNLLVFLHIEQKKRNLWLFWHMIKYKLFNVYDNELYHPLTSFHSKNRNKRMQNLTI